MMFSNGAFSFLTQEDWKLKQKEGAEKRWEFFKVDYRQKRLLAPWVASKRGNGSKKQLEDCTICQANIGCL